MRDPSQFHQPNGVGNGHHANRRLNGHGLRSPRRRRRVARRGVQGLLLIGGVGTIGILAIVLFSILGAVQAAVAGYSALNQNLPSINQIDGRETFKTAQIFDRKGTLLWEFYDTEGGKRTVVPLSDVSQYLIDATLAAEDATFYANPGVEVRGIARAMWQNMTEQELVSGASTITQQLVRNVLLAPNERYDRSMSRKVKEALLAYQLTQKLTKSQILQMYLNEIYYGNMAYGVEAAAEVYFAKRARDLTLAEAALISGLPQAPSEYDPYRNPVSAKQRQAYVLDQMERHGFITEQDAEAAKQERLVYRHIERNLQAPHWVMYVRDQIEKKYGPKLLTYGGLRVFTTLDLDLQYKLQEVAQNNSGMLQQRDANNTSIVAINPKTGEILAMVGSLDYFNQSIDGQVNVTVSERQPGSSIKPLVYMASFARDYTPSTVVNDEPINIRDDLGRVWSPQNFDRRFRGSVSLRSALGNSLNIPAVKVLQHVGIEPVMDLARRAGVTTWPDRNRLGLSLTLGGAEVRPVELAGVYALLANNGRRIPPVAITKLVDSEGNVLEDYRVPQGEQIVDPRAAYMVTDILRDNNARLVTYGPNSLLKMDRPVAVKTGTTDNFRDTWTAGYTPNMVIVAWVGNSDGHPMREVLSSMSAGKVWRDAMDTSIAYLQLPAEDFARPDGLISAEVCGDNHMRPGASACYQELFPYERAPKQGRQYLPGARPEATAQPTSATPGANPNGRAPTSTVPANQAVVPAETHQTVPGPNAQPTAQPTPATAQPKPQATSAPTRAKPTVQATTAPTQAKPTAQPTATRDRR